MLGSRSGGDADAGSQQQNPEVKLEVSPELAASKAKKNPYAIKIPSKATIVENHIKEKYSQFERNPDLTATTFDVVHPVHPASYLFGKAKCWFAKQLHKVNLRPKWNPEEPKKYSTHVQHNKKINVPLSKMSSLDYIVVGPEGGEQQLVNISLNTTQEKLRQHIRQGVLSPGRFTPLTTKVIADIGQYCLKESERLLAGEISSRYRAKNELREMIQDRVEKLQPLERLLNLHKYKPGHHREAIKLELKRYIEALEALRRAAENDASFQHAAVFEPGVRVAIQNKIEADITAAKTLRNKLHQLPKQYSTADSLNNALYSFIYERVGDHIQEIETRNRLCSYSEADPMAVKGDLHNAVQDAFKDWKSYKRDYHNPITKEAQGIVDTSQAEASVKLFTTLPSSPEGMAATLARAAMVEGRYSVKFQRQTRAAARQAQPDSRLQKIQARSPANFAEQAVIVKHDNDGKPEGAAITLTTVSSTKWNRTHVGNPAVGLWRTLVAGPVVCLVDGVWGLLNGAQAALRGVKPSQRSLGNVLLPPAKTELPTTDLFKPVMQPVLDTEAPHLAWGVGLWKGAGNVVTSLVWNIARGVYELTESVPREYNNLHGDYAMRGVNWRINIPLPRCRCCDKENCTLTIGLGGKKLSYDDLLVRISAESELIAGEMKRIKDEANAELAKEHPALADSPNDPLVDASQRKPIRQVHGTFMGQAAPVMAGPQMPVDGGGGEEKIAEEKHQEQDSADLEAIRHTLRRFVNFHHEHSDNRHFIFEAAVHGIQGTVQAFTHTILQKQPLMGGIPFAVMGYLAGLCCYAPQDAAALGLSQGFINMSQYFGGLLSNGTNGKTIASSFLFAKLGAGSGEALVNGKDGWIVKLLQGLSKNPDLAYGYFFLAVAFGKFLIWQQLWSWLSQELADDQGIFWPFADGFAGAKIGLILYHLIESHQHFEPSELEEWKEILRDNVEELYREAKKISVDTDLTEEQEAEITASVDKLWQKKGMSKEDFESMVIDAFNANIQPPASIAAPVPLAEQKSPISPSASNVPLSINVASPAGPSSIALEPLRAGSSVSPSSAVQGSGSDAEQADEKVAEPLSQAQGQGAEIKTAYQEPPEKIKARQRFNLLKLMMQESAQLPYLSAEAKYFLKQHLENLFPDDLAKGLYELAKPPKEKSIATTTVGDLLEYVPVLARSVATLPVLSPNGWLKLCQLLKRDLASLTTLTEGLCEVMVNDILRHLGKLCSIPADFIGRLHSTSGNTESSIEMAENPLYNGKVYDSVTRGTAKLLRSPFGFFGRLSSRLAIGVSPESRGHSNAGTALNEAMKLTLSRSS